MKPLFWTMVLLRAVQIRDRQVMLLGKGLIIGQHILQGIGIGFRIPDGRRCIRHGGVEFTKVLGPL